MSKSKKKINVKITLMNKPSKQALINFTRIVVQLYLEGKITAENLKAE